MKILKLSLSIAAVFITIGASVFGLAILDNYFQNNPKEYSLTDNEINQLINPQEISSRVVFEWTPPNGVGQYLVIAKKRITKGDVFSVCKTLSEKYSDKQVIHASIFDNETAAAMGDNKNLRLLIDERWLKIAPTPINYLVFKASERYYDRHHIGYFDKYESGGASCTVFERPYLMPAKIHNVSYAL